MGKHCVYFKTSDHYRKECTKAPEEKHRYFTCGNKGHVARNCHRAITDSNISSKRRRDSTKNPKASKVITPVSIKQATPATELTAPTKVISENEGVDMPIVQVDAAYDAIAQVDIPETLATPIPPTHPLLIPCLFKAGQAI
ncbi:hypothetical protein RMATCC62417_18051 [Rhizopus microsporus]|nr:hypothetical protein RMATCC62417_18051 [Rhizopus microsporus]